jgi:hypothetical protein
METEVFQFTAAGEIKVVLNGVEHLLRRPRARQSLKFEQELQEAIKGSRPLTITMVDFIVECGMNRDVVLDEMDLDLINELTTALIQGKKKS